MREKKSSSQPDLTMRVSIPCMAVRVLSGFLAGILLILACMSAPFGVAFSSGHGAMTAVEQQDMSLPSPEGLLNQPLQDSSSHVLAYDMIQDNGLFQQSISDMDDIGAISPDSYLLMASTPDYFFEQMDANGSSVVLQDVSVETTKQGDYYRSTVHFTLKNTQYWWRQQYATSFRIPDGVFVTNYYLDIEGTRKDGLLAERNSAQWIYDRVVSRALDPGLVYYEGRYLTMRVFPFAGDEERYTGIEFLHKDPVSLQIDGRTVKLASDEETSLQPQPIGDRAVYLSAAYKETLSVGQRRPRYIFVADCSEGSDVGEIVQRLRSFCTENNIVRDEATIYAVNDTRKSVPMTDQNWGQQLLNVRREGDFRLADAVSYIEREYNNDEYYPVIIAVRTKSSNVGVMWPKTNTSMAQRIPELEGYYMLTGKYLRLYGFDSRKSVAIDKLPNPAKTVSTVIDGQTFWMRDDGQPEILVREKPVSGQASPQGEWEKAVALMANYRRMGTQSPSQQPTTQLSLVKSSFSNKVMLPVTSFIVLETEEQETRMLNFQKRLLDSGNIEEEFEKSNTDSMEQYDEEYVDEDDDEEPDDDDGINPATGGDNANPATGNDRFESSAANWTLFVWLFPVSGLVVFIIYRKRYVGKIR